MIREEMGEESYWIGCIAPLAPMIGHVDSIRLKAWGVLLINKGFSEREARIAINDLTGLEKAFVCKWSPCASERLGCLTELSASLGKHCAALFFIGREDALPSPKLGINGQEIPELK
ncbi:MAG: hypothetical protein ACM3WV_05190 [Bacillota bacterium]